MKHLQTQGERAIAAGVVAIAALYLLMVWSSVMVVIKSGNWFPIIVSITLPVALLLMITWIRKGED